MSRWKPATSVAATGGRSDFMQLLTVDFSPLEKRFEEVFARLEALEHVKVAAVKGLGNPELPTTVSPESPRDDSSDHSSANVGIVMDPGQLAKELEALLATQLRLKIDHELAQSTYKVEMEALRRDLLVLPQHADLYNFRAEIDVLLSTTVKSLGDQQSLLWQDVERAMAARDLAENQWKSQFESTMNTRIQELWSGFLASQQKVGEAMTSLEMDMFKVEAATREATSTVEVMQRSVSDLEKRMHKGEEDGVSYSHEIAQLHSLIRQSNSMMAIQDATLQSAIDELNGQLQKTEERHTTERREYDGFVADVEKTMAFCTAEINTTIQLALQAHQDKLLALDAGVTKLTAELTGCQEHLQKNDSRLGSLDGRLVQQEKQSVTLAHMLQDQHHEVGRHIADVQKALDQASQDRVSIKRHATEMSFTIHEVQQTLQEVGKMAAATELSLTRTAAEIPKLHVLASTNVANITKNRQTLADLQYTLEEGRKLTQQLQHNFDKEVQSSVARFGDLHERHQDTQQSIATTNSTMQQMRHSLEESIKYNSNMVHQLNTMVDSLAITEGATDMDDKLARFALQVAELGLKLEHFVANTASSGMSTSSSTGGIALVKDDVKADLAVLLAKLIRFVGSGVSIDQNKYFLSTSKLSLPSYDPTSGALVFELPAGHVLDQLRAARVTTFVSKMREFMDQLRPVARTVSHVYDFRGHFERKVQYVIEFGLANLFPNLGRPRHPNRKNPNAGTCIACDRPLDEDEDDRSGVRIVEATDPEVAAVDELKLRRSKLVTSAAATSSGVAHKIDTRTPIKGRSGGGAALSPYKTRPRSAMAPRTAAVASEDTPSSVHQVPGTGDYVYRAGFRLPRPSSGSVKTASAGELAALTGLVVAAGTPALPSEDAGARQTLDDTVSSCLEKVGLVGKHSRPTVDIPKPAMAAASPLVRPHTAPLRSRSLPRLEGPEEP